MARRAVVANVGEPLGIAAADLVVEIDVEPVRRQAGQDFALSLENISAGAAVELNDGGVAP